MVLFSVIKLISDASKPGLYYLSALALGGCPDFYFTTNPAGFGPSGF